MATPCPFCSLPPERVLASNPLAFVIRDGYPVSPGHTLIIPRRHVGSFFEISEEERAAMLALLDGQKRALDAEYSPAGYNVGIVDGDTADIRIGKSRLERLRLTEIDAPERGAPWSKRSKQLLSDLIYGEEVMIAITDWDRYDRAVARIFLWSDDGDALVDVSQQMIQQGGAWYFERFGRDRSMLIAESIARRTRAGLWSLPDRERVPPWEWRKMPKEERDLHR